MSSVQDKSVALATGLFQFLRKESWWRLAEHGIATVTLLMIFKFVRRNGMKKTFQKLLSGALKTIPGAQSTVSAEITKEVDKAVVDLFKKSNEVGALVVPSTTIPKQGMTKDEIYNAMKTLYSMDTDPSTGRVWAYVYETADHKDFEDVIKMAHNMFMNKNALNPFAFPSLRRFENEVVSMSIKMLNGDADVKGNMTSGGTESILVAIKAYRDRARALFGITDPEIVLPITAHAAFEKAGHTFGVKTVYVPFTSKYRADVNAMRKAINKNTILLVASAPGYPHGVMDPVEEIAQLAKEHNLPCHVDSCIGGFVLPWAEQLGYEIPKFDFRVDGVTSISADVHKYGFAAKGASVILYKNADFRKYQYFAYTEWPGGLFISPGMLGTRGGGSIAAAWASLCHLGQDGFLKNTKVAMEAAVYLKKEINNIEGLEVLGNPEGPLLSFASTSKSINVFAVADVMEDHYNWNIERQQKPDCIHLTVMPQHSQSSIAFIKDLKEAVEKVKKDPSLGHKGTAAMYGLVANISSTDLIEEFLYTLLGKVYS